MMKSEDRIQSPLGGSLARLPFLFVTAVMLKKDREMLDVQTMLSFMWYLTYLTFGASCVTLPNAETHLLVSQCSSQFIVSYTAREGVNSCTNIWITKCSE